MAATIQSYNTANPGSGSGITVTKPTGLAVGDLMIAHYAYSDATETMDTLSGWTHEIDNQSVGGVSIKTGIQWKIAQSGDVSASDFTFNFNGAVTSPIISLVRIDGHVTSDLLNDARQAQTNTGTPTYSNTVTPIAADSLMLFYITAADPGVSPGISDYAMQNDNPTWSELYQVNVASSHAIALGYATRSPSTATGTSSATISGGGTQDSVGIMIAIGSVVNVTLSPAVISVVASVQAPSVSADANVTVASTLSVTASVQAPTVSMPADTWTNQDKNSSSWTNTDKS